MREVNSTTTLNRTDLDHINRIVNTDVGRDAPNYASGSSYINANYWEKLCQISRRERLVMYIQDKKCRKGVQ